MTALALLKRFWWSIPIVVLVIALGITRHTLGSTKDKLADATAFGKAVYEATRDASGNPKLAQRDTAAQIAAMGRSADRLRSGLATCTSTARAAADNDAARQRALEVALNAATADQAARQAAIDRLRTSAAHPAPAPAPGTCEPSATLREIWR